MADVDPGRARERVERLVASIPTDRFDRPVPARPGQSVGGLVAELSARPPVDAATLCRFVITEHDLRGALDLPGARELADLSGPLDVLAEHFSATVSARGLPSLRITAEQWGCVVGPDPEFPRSCLVADRFELFRGLAGRRSRRQLLTWSWSADPSAYLDCLETLPADLLERDPRVPLELQLADLR